VRIIDNTEVGKFLNLYNNAALVECLGRVFAEDPTSNGSASEEFLFGKRVDGIRQPNGIWDEVSQRFVSQARGEVVTLTGGAPSDGVFRLTELPELLKNESLITHIDGIPIGVLRSLGPERAFEVIRAQSEVRAAELRVAVDDRGMPLLAEQMAVDARLFLADQPNLTVVAPAVTTAMRPLADFVPSTRLPVHAQGADTLQQLRTDLVVEANSHAVNGRADDLARVVSVLGRLGTAGDVIDLAMLAHQAAAFHQAGDTESAHRLLTDWAIRNASALVAGRLASLAVAPLLLAGPVGITLAVALVLGAGLAGDQAGAQLSSWLRNATGDWTPDYQRQLQERFDMPTPGYGCPLILDLDGDGVETISWAQSGVFFDHDGNRFAERTGWVSPDDALLVHDLDGDGQIRSGAELFGNNTLLPNGSRAANGFAALRVHDLDGNGRIDAADPVWSRLRLWRDGDGDGAVDPGELSALGSQGVHSLSTAYTNSSELDGAGNAHRQLGTYTTSTGSQRALTDIWFAFNPAWSRATDIQRVDASVAVLPDIPGMGLVPSLHQAMARDGSGRLRDLVQRWVAGDAIARSSLLDSLLFHWAGVQSVDPRSYGSGIAEGRKVAALEAFLADRYRDGAVPDAFGASQLELAFDALRRRVAARLILQVDLAPMLLAFHPEPTNGAVAQALNVDAGVAMLRDYLLKGNPEAQARALSAAITELGREPMAPLIEGARLAALSAPQNLFLPLLAIEGQTLIRQGPAPSGLFGGAAGELIVGNDHGGFIDGRGGDDILVGGLGSEVLYGGAGRNTFVFGLGDGRDVIAWEHLPGQHADNTLAFRAGIRPQDLLFQPDAWGDLAISIAGSTDEVRIQAFRPHNAPSPFNARQHLGWITFADGTRWSAEELRLRLNQGTDGADVLDGDYRSETIRGGAGNDRIRSFGGDDLLDGGSGSDQLDGGSGSDTYLIRRGEGRDVITDLSDGNPHRDMVQFGPGIGPGNVRFYRSNVKWDLDLHIQIDGNPHALSIRSFFWGGLPEHFWRWSVEEFRFEDGSVWTDEQIRTRLLAGNAESQFLVGYFGDDTIQGLDGDDRIGGLHGNDQLEGGNGDDRLEGDSGDDLLIGGPGNDWLDGGSGSNVYLFEGEVGRDVIASRSEPLQGDPGRIQIHGSVLAPEAIRLRRVDNDLEIVESGSNAGNAVLVQDYFLDNSSANRRNPVQSISWWGGPSWDLATIDSRVSNLYRGGSGDDQLTGTADHDFLEGFAGDDTLHGGPGNDRLDGGEGIDTASWAGSVTDVTVDLSLTGPQATGAGMDTLVAIENLQGGDGHDRLLGNGGDNRIDGGAGDDTLHGGAGDDRLDGGEGIDTASWAGSATPVTVDLSILGPQATGAGMDTLVAIENLQGGNGHDRLLGNGGDNRIDGGAGNDTLHGGLGDDRLDGGVGIDTASWAGSATGVTVDLSLTGPQATGAGMDTLVAIENLQGGNGHDRLLGNGGNNRIDGGAGDDTLHGGPGDDRLDGGVGIDTASWAGSATGVTVDLSLTSPQATGAGKDTLVAIENLQGGNGHDRLLGNAGNNRIDGGAGNDTLHGGPGDDRLDGGEGIDTASWAGSATGVTVDLSLTSPQATGAGKDTLVAIENLQGGNGHDRLLGNGGDNRIDGGAGNDTLQGGAGDDRLDGGVGIDTASWAGSATGVTVDLSLTGPQATGVGIDTLVAIENLQGGNGHDRLLGNGGDNRIDGGAGDDTIDGGAGSDLLLGGLGVDTVSFASAPSSVTVDLANTGAQRTVGNWSDTITGFENLVGSAWNDTLTGSAAANRLDGGAGADRIRGGEGADRLTGGAGADRFTYASLTEAGNGTATRDLITDLESSDRIDLSLIDAHSSLTGDQAFVFIGAAAFTAPGQLRYSVMAGVGLLEGNVDSNRSADFQITLAGAPNLTAGWIVL
jgi:Ca2+-binding RTX toxin-like protein